MQYRAKKTVNLGGGLLLTEGMTIELAPNTVIPGLEPVLENPRSSPTLERVSGEKPLDAPFKGGCITG